jgi:hypothetical protein
MDLLEFLRQRLDEDERAAEAGQYSDVVAMVARQSGKRNALNFWHRHDPARVLAEVAAKRRIVEVHPPNPRGSAQGNLCQACDVHGGGPYPCETLRLLALPYAEHEGYREEWRP